ncbi:DUF3224 domain-containing protein [Thalassotalea agarivorans]|uniref:DUF3224 domain-containing protein n=1 Tax=Thalassotalea agarivorans TaxID=349064 RepID=A0A1I0G9F5_THASX|nr:DUF3224 domain-containing protein [Thalassotalea agarivorans]SET67508.1 Protein of unknown function [Thalassotalea agarivorans]
MEISGSFTIQSWDEQDLQSFTEQSKMVSAHIKQMYEGDLQGESNVEYVMAYKTDGTAEFTGLEHFSGTLKGNPVQWVFKHLGMFQNGIATSQFTLVEDLTDTVKHTLAGSFSATHGGKADYMIRVKNA